jgi:NhaA family Na+:H+ antiporter
VPLFALANAGVMLGGDAVRDAFTSRLTWGIVAGLVAGKMLGIGGAAWLALRTRVAVLPPGVDARHVIGLGALGGIGFTVSLFVADLAFAGANLADAKIAVLTASVLAAVLAAVVLAPRRARHAARAG